MRIYISFFLLLLVFLAADSTYGATTFDPQCTFPPSSVNLGSSPGVRATLDIPWSSPFTLIVCTWTIQHLNIPEGRPSDVKAPGDALISLFKRGGLKPFLVASRWTLKRVWSKGKWMLITLVIPEFLVGKAAKDWIQARKHLEELLEIAE